MSRLRIPAEAITSVRETERVVGEHVIGAVLISARRRAFARQVAISPLPTAFVLWMAGRAQPLREVARGFEIESEGDVPAFLARAVLKAIDGVPPGRLLDAAVEARCRRRVALAFRLRRRTALRRTALALAYVATANGDRHARHERLPLVSPDRPERVHFGEGSGAADQHEPARRVVHDVQGGDRGAAEVVGGDAQGRAGGETPRADARPLTPALCACGCGLALWPVGTAVVHRVLGGARVAAWIPQDCELVPVRFADGEYGGVRRGDLIAEGA